MKLREQLLNMPTYVLPQDAQRLRAEWWTAKDAAEAWGCSYSTAYHIIQRHPFEVKRQLVEVITPFGGGVREMIPAGRHRPITRGGGNPRLTSEEQSKRAKKRWK